MRRWPYHGSGTERRANTFIIRIILLVTAMLALASPSNAQYLITEIIDATGDGAGNTLNNPWQAAVDSNGNVYVTGISSDNAFKITPGGTITEIIDSTGDGGRTLDAGRGVAVDSSGNVYVAGYYSANVFKIATPGTCSTAGTPCTITEIIDSTGDGGGNPLGRAQGVAVDSSDNVYVVGHTSHNIFKIATPGTCSTNGTPCTITEIIDSTGDGAGNTVSYPTLVAVDSSNNVYVVGRDSDNAFKIATPGTCSTNGTPCTITEIIDLGAASWGAWGVAVDSNGNVYVTGCDNANAFKIATPGTCSTNGTPCTITEIIDSAGDGSGNSLGRAIGVAVDSNGNVYVTSES
jgi:hypothetical protein